jgi:predicted MPP superfamily phosphohydrolase
MPWSLRMLMMLTVAGGLFQWYVARRTIKSVAALSGWPEKRIRMTALGIFFWIISYPLVMVGSYFLGMGHVSRALQQSSSALLDAVIVYPFWIGIVFAVQVALLLLLIDLTRLVLFPIYKKRKARWARAQAWLVVALVLVGAVYVPARVYSDTLTLRTRETELRVANLPEELDGFRIVQIADLQADARTRGRKLQAYVDRVNQLKPDLILFAGDLVTSGTDYIETGAEALGKMESRHGIYACLGDHDFFSNLQMVSGSLQKNGVNVLDDVAAVVPVGSSFISITGITNVYARPRPTPAALESIERQRPAAPVNIFLTHQPSPAIVDHATASGYDLFVAGHTHGGQIVFPLPGFLLTGSSFETRYVTGFYDVGRMLASITNGLGLTLAPIRYHAPAEVTLILLKPQNS